MVLIKSLKSLKKKKKSLKDKFPNSRLKDRIVTKLAVFTTTARLLKETITLNIDISSILDILYDQEVNTIPNRDIGLIAYEKLLQYLLANIARLSYNSYKTTWFPQRQFYLYYKRPAD